MFMPFLHTHISHTTSTKTQEGRHLVDDRSKALLHPIVEKRRATLDDRFDELLLCSDLFETSPLTDCYSQPDRLVKPMHAAQDINQASSRRFGKGGRISVGVGWRFPSAKYRYSERAFQIQKSSFLVPMNSTLKFSEL